MRIRPRGLWWKPDAQRLEIHGGCLPPYVHLMLTGSSRGYRELRGGDRDGYAWSCVGGGSKWRGRLNWTGGRKTLLREPRARSCKAVYRNAARKGFYRWEHSNGQRTGQRKLVSTTCRVQGAVPRSAVTAAGTAALAWCWYTTTTV